MRAALPSGASLHVGIYVSGAVQPQSLPDWDCSTPSASYARMALEAALAAPEVDGTVHS